MDVLSVTCRDTKFEERADLIVLQENGRIRNIQGEAAVNSQVPVAPENTLALFETKYGANTLNDSDVTTRPFRYKRFTMSDIASLQERIETL